MSFSLKSLRRDVIYLAVIFGLAGFIFFEKKTNHEGVLLANLKETMPGYLRALNWENRYNLLTLDKINGAYKTIDGDNFTNKAQRATKLVDSYNLAIEKTINLLTQDIKSCNNIPRASLKEIQSKTIELRDSLLEIAAGEKRVSDCIQMGKTDLSDDFIRDCTLDELIFALQNLEVKALTAAVCASHFNGCVMDVEYCPTPVVVSETINPKVGEEVNLKVFLTKFTEDPNLTDCLLNGKSIGLKNGFTTVKQTFDQPGRQKLTAKFTSIDPSNGQTTVYEQDYFINITPR